MRPDATVREIKEEFRTVEELPSKNCLSVSAAQLLELDPVSNTTVIEELVKVSSGRATDRLKD